MFSHPLYYTDFIAKCFYMFLLYFHIFTRKMKQLILELLDVSLGDCVWIQMFAELKSKYTNFLLLKKHPSLFCVCYLYQIYNIMNIDIITQATSWYMKSYNIYLSTWHLLQSLKTSVRECLAWFLLYPFQKHMCYFNILNRDSAEVKFLLREKDKPHRRLVSEWFGLEESLKII